MADYDDDDDDMGAGEGIAGADYREVEIREQDRYLPIANIARIMKRVLPGNTKIAKDAKESIQACVSEFISFITSEASDKCQLEKRKTINGDDLLWAMSTLGFDQYGAPLQVYLNKYRESVKGEKPEKGKAGSAAKVSAAAQPKSSGKPASAAATYSSGYGVSSGMASAAAASSSSSSSSYSASYASSASQPKAPGNCKPPPVATLSVLDFLGINLCELASSAISKQQTCEQAVTAGLTSLSVVLQAAPCDEATTNTLKFHMRSFMEQEYSRQLSLNQQHHLSQQHHQQQQNVT